MTKSILLGLSLVLGSLGTARANPHPLPFSYPYETLPEGKVEVEQYLDVVPVRVEREEPDGTMKRVWSTRSVLTTELELGLTDRLELGFYLQFDQAASGSDPALRFDGVKQRLRYRFAETGELPVDLGVYLEIAERHDEIELEEKLLVSKRLGALVLVANLWVEQEWKFQDSEVEYIYSPTAGAAFEISPRFQVGLEYWARGQFGSGEAEAGEEGESGARHYLGPTFLYQQGPVFLALGVYARLDELGESAVVADPFGKIWLRSIVGLEL